MSTVKSIETLLSSGSVEASSHWFEGSMLASEEGTCKLVEENKLIGTKLLPFVCGGI